LIKIVHREIENGEPGQSVIRLQINENIIAAGDAQRQQTIRFRNLKPKCSAADFFRLLNVANRKTTKCLAIS
jgi:hypothetical protein